MPRVFDHYYGTPSLPVEEALMAGRDMLFDIDWQGTQQLREKGRDDLVTVFILPPSTRDLETPPDLAGAGSHPTIVARRMAKAADEMSHWAEYDYTISQQATSAPSVIAAQGHPDGRAAEARASARHVGFRQGVARGAVIGWPMPVLALRAQHELARAHRDGPRTRRSGDRSRSRWCSSRRRMKVGLVQARSRSPAGTRWPQLPAFLRQSRRFHSRPSEVATGVTGRLRSR